MKKNLAYLTMMLLWSLSFEVHSANSIENLRINFAQVSTETREAPNDGKYKQKIGRKLFKQKIRTVLENAAPISNGGIALLLLFSSLIVLLLMPAFAMLSIAFYLTSLFFAVLGLGRDKNKLPAILAISLALLPVLLLIAFLIDCRIHGCFD